ncbi:MAG TPA: carboxymuconolactone decarboxylase family protein [Oculatellaceae cyanobacterium]
MAVMQVADTSKLTGKNSEMLAQMEKSMGLTPNIMKQMANSPAALEAFLLSKDSLSKGMLTERMRLLIGILIAETYSCGYMLSARVAQAKKAGMSDDDIRIAKDQCSKDPKEDRGLQFVRNLILRHGELPPSEVAELKAVGYNEGEIVELIANTSMNMQVYYLVQIANPEADFPAVATQFPA